MLVGVLVDVSGSMKSSLQLNVEPTDQHLTRAEYIFSTIIKIAEPKVDGYDNQEIFVLAFGIQDGSTCDLLFLLDIINTLNEQNVIGYNPLIQLLADNGAPHARKYVTKHLNEKEAEFLFAVYSKNISILREFIEQLPSACKGSLSDVYSKGSPYELPELMSACKNFFKGSFTRGAISSSFGLLDDKEKEVTRQQADHAIKKAKSMMSRPKNKTLKSTIDLLQKVAGTSSSSSSSPQKSLSAAQLSKLVNSIEPYIYGNTPMCEALRSALDMFSSSAHNVKVLFLLSDGEATDGSPVQFVKQLRNSDVLVFVCLLTSDNISHPRRLYYESDPNWSKAQRDMFELSSTVENTHSAMSILLEQEWELPASGHSRLFIQANHPDVIDEFSSLVLHIAESNEALLNIFGRVTLDKYINSSNSTFKPNDQMGGTCYANAVAAVLHLAMDRIEGREGGVPDFYEILIELIDEYGDEGANTEKVLSEWTPKYRLQYKEVDELQARQAVNARRPVVATFRLYKEKWEAFAKFYKDNPQGILETKDLDTCSSLTEESGHAVVLIKIDPKSLMFMNSWGTTFADGGFFKVRNQSVLDLKFYDVYWTSNDLKKSEIEAFNQKSRKVGEDFVRGLPENVQNLPYECPRCQQSSPAIMFDGHLLEATCPKCNQNFKPTPIGFILNSYTR